MSTNKYSPLLTTHGFLSPRYQPANVYGDLVMETVTDPLAGLERKAKTAELAHPTEHNQTALSKLTVCKETIQSVLQTCLQPDSPLTIFKQG